MLGSTLTNINMADFLQSCVNDNCDMADDSRYYTGRTRIATSSPSLPSPTAPAEDDDDEDAYLAGDSSVTFSDTDMLPQRACWNCRGFGHSKIECPSFKGFRAAFATVISMLQNAMAAKTSTAKGKGKGTSKGKGRGAGRGAGRGRAAQQAAGAAL